MNTYSYFPKTTANAIGHIPSICGQWNKIVCKNIISCKY